MDNKICEYNTIGHIFPNGDEDRYCTNDECVMCTFPICDYVCTFCSEFVDKIVKEKENL